MSDIGSVSKILWPGQVQVDPTAKRLNAIKGNSKGDDSRSDRLAEDRAQARKDAQELSDLQTSKRDQAQKQREALQDRSHQEGIRQDRQRQLDEHTATQQASLQNAQHAIGHGEGHNLGALSLSQLSMNGGLSLERVSEVGEEQAALETFESYMVQMMLKEMRKTIPEGMFSSNAMDMFMDMFDQAIAEQMAKKGGIGLADTMEQQMGLYDEDSGFSSSANADSFQNGSSQGDSSFGLLGQELSAAQTSNSNRNNLSPEQQSKLRSMLQDMEAEGTLSPLSNRSSVWENWMLSGGEVPEELYADRIWDPEEALDESSFQDVQLSMERPDLESRPDENNSSGSSILNMPYSNEALSELRELFSSLSSQMGFENRANMGLDGPLDTSIQNRATDSANGADSAGSSGLEQFEHRMPVEGSISSHYGMRHHPISHDWKHHNGLDIAAPTGTPIAPTAPGLVTLSGQRKGLGNVVVIDHGNGWMSTYAHCDTLNVAVGDQVSRGDVIATVGETGAATGPHLHLELRKDGVLVNPTDVMDLHLEDEHQHDDLSEANIW